MFRFVDRVPSFRPCYELCSPECRTSVHACVRGGPEGLLGVVGTPRVKW